MKNLITVFIRYKWLMLLVFIVITAFFGLQLRNIRINSDIMKSLPDNDPIAKLYKDTGKKYQGNDMGIIIVETENIFQKDVLEHIKQITDSLRTIQGILTVTSLTNIIDIKSTPEGLEIGRLIDEYNMPTEKSQLDSIKKYVFSKEMYAGSIVSEDTTASIVTFTFSEEANREDDVKLLKQKITKMNLPEKIYYGGMPCMVNDMSDKILSDLIRLLPIIIVVIVLVLLLSFRSFKGVVLPLLTSGVAVIWTIGTMMLLGYELTLVTNNMPVILFAVGSAYTIHVVNRINQTRGKKYDDVIINAVAYITIPVFLAATTTLIGFISFIFGSYLTMIRDFGLFTALGTAYALIISLVFIPVILALFPSKKTKRNEIRKQQDNSIEKGKLTSSLLNVIFKHPSKILVIWSILILTGIIGIFFIHTSVDISKYFRKNSSSRMAEDILQSKFSGSVPVFVIFSGDMQSPSVLTIMDKTRDFLRENKNIQHTQSIADLVKEMNDAMGEGKKIPDSKEKIEQLWFLLDGQDIIPQLVADDKMEGIIQARFASTNSDTLNRFIASMEQYIKNTETSDCRIQLTGMPNVYKKLNSSLILSQFSSIGIALILLILLVGITLKNMKQGLYAAIPVIVTIIILFGFMGLAGIRLDIATVLVASVALGIGIDYSIHIISHYNHAVRNLLTPDEALKDTLLVSGKAVIINVLSVTAGFLVLLFSEFLPLENFGLLVALCMITSGMGALTLLPVVLLKFSSRKLNTKNK